MFEPALHPTPGSLTLTFPVDDTALDAADPVALTRTARRWPLVYVGNQYGRDPEFDAFFAPAARTHRHCVGGKWTETSSWPHVDFIGRVGFAEGQDLHRHALTTVLLLPERYAAVAHMTSRLAEAVLAGCLPIGPATIRDIARFVPADLQAEDGAHVAAIISTLLKASAEGRADLLAACLARLEPFRASVQLATVTRVLSSP